MNVLSQSEVSEEKRRKGLKLLKIMIALHELIMVKVDYRDCPGSACL